MTIKSILIFIVLPLIIFISILGFIIYIIYKKYKYKVENICYETVKKSLTNINLMYFKYNDFYNIYVERNYDIFYFKILNDTKDKYLEVTNNNEYFLLQNPTDELVNPLNIQDFIKFKPSLDGKNRYYKVLVLYPSAKQKLMYENEYFAKFIYDDIKVNDVFIIDYTDLEKFLKEKNITSN